MTKTIMLVAMTLSVISLLGWQQLPQPEQLRNAEQIQVQSNYTSGLNLAKAQLSSRSGPCSSTLPLGEHSSVTVEVWWPGTCTPPPHTLQPEGAIITARSGDQLLRRSWP